MAKRVSAAEAKAHFSAVATEVADGGPHVIIERWNRPWVALVRVSDLEHLEQSQATSERTLAWPGRRRRLSKNYEGRTDSAEAWIRIAMIRLMLKRLASH